MHILAVAEMIKSVRRRQAQGDCPTEAPFGREQLEDALVTLADQLEKIAPGRLQGLPDPAVLERQILANPDVDSEAGLPMPLKRSYGALPPSSMEWMMGRTAEDIDAIWEEADRTGLTPAEVTATWPTQPVDLSK